MDALDSGAMKGLMMVGVSLVKRPSFPMIFWDFASPVISM